MDQKFYDVDSARFVNSLTVQHDHEQLITKSTNRLQLHCLPWCQNRSPRSSLPTVPIQRLPQCNRLLAVVRIRKICIVTSDAIKRISTNFLRIIIKFSKIREFLRIFNTEVTNSQSMWLKTICSKSVNRIKLVVKQHTKDGRNDQEKQKQ